MFVCIGIDQCLTPHGIRMGTHPTPNDRSNGIAMWFLRIVIPSHSSVGAILDHALYIYVTGQYWWIGGMDDSCRTKFGSLS